MNWYYRIPNVTMLIYPKK